MNAENEKQLGRPDWWLLAITGILLAFGLMMVFSASGIYAERVQADTYYFFKRQLLFAGCGCCAMALAATLPRSLLYRLQYPLLFGATAFLAVTLTPLGVGAKGAHRWIAMGPFRMQPMEFAKIALVLYLAYFMSAKQELIKSFSRGVIPPFLVTAIMCVLLLLQPDFGGAALLCLLLFFMCLVGGTRLIYLIISAGVACAGAYLLITTAAYRFRRIVAFLDPFASASDEGYHLVQSFYAIGSGGITGVGLGASKQKLFYLPEAHNDFIVAVLAEETGIIGLTLLFILMGAFFWRCMMIALKQQDLRDRLTAFGLLLVLALSMVLNMAVVLGTAPPKGIPMPLLSYGGSSLLASLLCVGLLLNISRTGKA
jgi:cell division protein FtsW